MKPFATAPHTLRFLTGHGGDDKGVQGREAEQQDT